MASLMFTLLSCHRNTDLSMTFENVLMRADDSTGENESVLLYVKATNNTSDDIILNHYVPSDFINKRYQGWPENSGFYLMSDEFYSGAIKLPTSFDPFEGKIAKGKSQKLFLRLSVSKFKSLLFEMNRMENPSYSNLIDFFKQGDYYLIYVSNAKPSALVVPRSEKFEVVATNSGDITNKILTQ
jgi:hypothetical protein